MHMPDIHSLLSPKRLINNNADQSRFQDKQHGFTLIELMIVVVILGIIAAFAIPSYQDHMRKTRRSDAKSALSDLAARQEQFFLDNKTYTTVLADLNATATSPEGYYTIAISPAPATTATAFQLVASNPTFVDPQCATLTIDHLGLKTSAPNTNCW